MRYNILTFDIEEVWHGEYTRCFKPRTYNTIRNIKVVLDLLDEYNATATFFIVCEIVNKFPEIMECLVARGHEISVHGWDHTPLWYMNPELFKRKLIKCIELIYGTIKEKPLGYRAPSFSLDNSTKWALSVLADLNFVYDSSVFPMRTPLYGVPSAPVYPYKPDYNDVSKVNPETRIIELPPLVLQIINVIRIPIAGGFYLRLVPLWLISEAIKIHNRRGYPAVMYVHNWELDSKILKLPLKFHKSFIVYYNVGKKTKQKLRCLLKSFKFMSIREWLEKNIF